MALGILLSYLGLKGIRSTATPAETISKRERAANTFFDSDGLKTTLKNEGSSEFNLGATWEAKQLAVRLGSDVSSESEAAAENLVKVGRTAIPVLINVIQTNNQSWARRRAVWALGQIEDPSAIDILVNALSDGKYDVRAEAAVALGKLGDQRSIEPLVAALKDKDSNVRSAAGSALGGLGRPALEPLLSILSDPSHIGRADAAYALGTIKDARALEPLIITLNDETKDVRWKAASALGDIGDARAVEPLITFLQAKEGFERSIAVSALGKIGDTRAFTSFLAALKDNDKYVRRNAAEALGTLGNAQALEPLRGLLNDKDVKVRERAAWALEAIQKKIGVEAGREPWQFLRRTLLVDPGKVDLDLVVLQVRDEISQLPEESVFGYKKFLLSQLQTYQNLNDLYATKEALQSIEVITLRFPVEKLRKNMGEQVIGDFNIYPIWEAGSLAIDSYVPWGDVAYMSHEGSATMSRLLLEIAARALLWLRIRPSRFVQYRSQRSPAEPEA